MDKSINLSSRHNLSPKYWDDKFVKEFSYKIEELKYELLKNRKKDLLHEMQYVFMLYAVNSSLDAGIWAEDFIETVGEIYDVQIESRTDNE